jgi:hypothetical protein
VAFVAWLIEWYGVREVLPEMNVATLQQAFDFGPPHRLAQPDLDFREELRELV